MLDGPQVEIGGNARYLSVLRAEYKRVLCGERATGPKQASLPPLPGLVSADGGDD